MSKRKPYNDVAGYVGSLKCKAPCGGHIVIYDREGSRVGRGDFEIDANDRYIVMHEPSSLHVSAKSLPLAREIMKAAARGDDVAGILPEATP